MIDEAPRTPPIDRAASSPPDGAPVDVCATAITELVRLVLELTSANAAIDYGNGARVREELDHGFLEAQKMFEALPEGPSRADVLRRLDGLRTLADRQLAIAPAPSASAIAAAKAGDSSAWLREADVWVAARLGHGANRPQPPRRPRSDTRPERPGALRIEPVDSDRTPQGSAASKAAMNSAPDKVGRP